jgi:hypothetical protein
MLHDDGEKFFEPYASRLRSDTDDPAAVRVREVIFNK